MEFGTAKEDMPKSKIDSKVTTVPYFSTSSKVFRDSILLEINCHQSEAANTIYYTTDGSKPTNKSLLYEQPLFLTADATIKAKHASRLGFEELRTVDTVDTDGSPVKIVVSRLSEVRFVDVNTGIVLSSHNIPYGSKLYASEDELVEKGKVVAAWDPFNAVIVTEVAGKVEFESVIENVTYKVETDESTGLHEIVIIESKDKNKIPTVHINDENGNSLHNYNLPVGGHVVVEDGDVLKAGDVIVKIPRVFGSAGDITGGLPRVTELFEARNPSNPAVVSEIDGEVTMGKVKRGNREIVVTSKVGDVKKYLVALSKQILVQEGDTVAADAALVVVE